MLRFIAITLFDRNVLSIFQYIPCYGLSVSASCSGSASCSFQYIPCYGLSQTGFAKDRSKDDFNTSHVTVYHPTEKGVICVNRYFNTSHVTVYPRKSKEFTRNRSISIHPMLRFIAKGAAVHRPRRIISIHPMLRFIRSGRRATRAAALFQYIPCYGLSNRSVKRIQIIPYFNTSHVTVYRKLFVAVKVWYPNFNTSHVTVYHHAGVGS